MPLPTLAVNLQALPLELASRRDIANIPLV